MEIKKELKVLVVDEEPQYFSALRDCAELCSHVVKVNCDFANSWERATEKIHSQKPSLVLLDLYIPGLPSFELLKECQANSIPVIVISSINSLHIEETARSFGAAGCVDKSEDPEELEEMLLNLSVWAGQDEIATN
jgi:two-component system, OmpR family, alkaline phosphatase synthesis response regulator PhoP